MKQTVILASLVAAILMIAGCSNCNPPCNSPCPPPPCHQDLKGEG